MAAIGEAVGVLRIPLDRIDLLSVGTAGLAPVIDPPSSTGLSGWALKAADLLLSSQMQAALLYSSQLLGDCMYRVDDGQPSVESLDDVLKLDYLIGRGVEVSKLHQNYVAERFLNGVRVRPWRPEA